MSKEIKYQTRVNGPVSKCKNLRIDVNGINYRLSIEVDGALKILKSDHTENMDENIHITPRMGNVIYLS